MKTCNYCKDPMPYEAYSLNKATKDGYSNRCRTCTSKVKNAKRVPVPRIKYDIDRIEKTCKACSELLPMDSFNKSKLLADGRENVCKLCRIKKRKKNAASGIFSDKIEKRCSHCKLTLSVDDFYKDKSRDDGFGVVCKPCKAKWHKEKYKDDEVYREKRRVAKNKWRSENLEKARKQERAYAKIHNATLAGKLSKYKFNAKKRGFAWNLTDEQFSTFWQKPCNYCGDKIETLGVDRVDSSKGYSLDNVVSCCEVCNRVKMAHDACFLKSHLEKMLANKDNW